MSTLSQSTVVETTHQSIDAATLKAWQDGLMIIDVRSGAEFDAVHIVGSYHVPLPMLSEHAGEFAARMGTRVVLVCQSGNRAGQARKHRGSVGLAGSSIFSGGVPAYAADSGTVIRGREVRALERQVRMAAGSLVLASIVAAKFVSPCWVWLVTAVPSSPSRRWSTVWDCRLLRRSRHRLSSSALPPRWRCCLEG